MQLGNHSACWCSQTHQRANCPRFPFHGSFIVAETPDWSSGSNGDWRASTGNGKPRSVGSVSVYRRRNSPVPTEKLRVFGFQSRVKSSQIFREIYFNSDFLKINIRGRFRAFVDKKKSDFRQKQFFFLFFFLLFQFRK